MWWFCQRRLEVTSVAEKTDGLTEEGGVTTFFIFFDDIVLLRCLPFFLLPLPLLLYFELSIPHMAWLLPRCFSFFLIPLLPLFELSIPPMLDLDQKGHTHLHLRVQLGILASALPPLASTFWAFCSSYVRLRPERHTIWTWICVCATFCACWSSFFLFLITHCDLNYAIVVIILYFVFFINQSIITALLLCSWCILSHLYLNYDRKVSGLYTTNCWTMPCGILNVYPRHILCIKHRNCFFKKNSIFLVRLALFLGAYFLFGSLFFETKLLLKR